MMKFVGARIKDPRVLRLVKVMLKAGVVNDMGGYDPTEQGSGQGSVCSPILSLIYMHYVLSLVYSTRERGKHLPIDRCFYRLWPYFSSRASMLHPRTLEIR